MYIISFLLLLWQITINLVTSSDSHLLSLISGYQKSSNEDVSSATPSGGLGENLSPSLFWLSEAMCLPWLTAVFFLQSHQASIQPLTYIPIPIFFFVLRWGSYDVVQSGLRLLGSSNPFSSASQVAGTTRVPWCQALLPLIDDTGLT